MILYDSRWCLIVFNPQDWRHVYQVLATVTLVAILGCEWLAPGWLPGLGVVPRLDWWHPETWWQHVWRGRL